MIWSNSKLGRLGVPLLVLLAGGSLALGACSAILPEEVADTDAGAALSVTPSATPARFQPTITPVPSPTDLPPVTPPTATPPSTVTPTATRDPNVPSVLMAPNLGELDQQVHITGFGFLPESDVNLYWVQPGASPGGSPLTTVEADESGEFALTLDVPDSWPGGPPADHDALELHAVGGEGRAAWAAYTYVTLFEEFVVPESSYTSPTYGYALDLPPGWVADDADPADVTFGPQDGSHASFVRVVATGGVDDAIAGVMPQVAPGETYVTEEIVFATEQATRVTVSGSGEVYTFVEHNGRVYVLHFVDADETVAEFTASTFRFTG